jgi:hypothetical protein
MMKRRIILSIITGLMSQMAFAVALPALKPPCDKMGGSYNERPIYMYNISTHWLSTSAATPAINLHADRSTTSPYYTFGAYMGWERPAGFDSRDQTDLGNGFGVILASMLRQGILYDQTLPAAICTKGGYLYGIEFKPLKWN